MPLRHLPACRPAARRGARRSTPLDAPPVDGHPAREGDRDAFTLVEVVVAIVLLATAALDVAATSTYLARLAASARAVALATRETASIVDSLRATPCASLAAGSRTTSAGTVRWTIAAAPGTRDIRAALAPSSTRVRQPIIEEALVPCD